LSCESGLIQPASGRANRTLVVRKQEVEESTVAQVKRQLTCALVEVADIETIQYRDSSLDHQIRGNRFTLNLREMLVYSQMVVDASELAESVEHRTIANGLFNQSLHAWTHYAASGRC
jgi:DNA-directed RNA polymerase sigma subunit (sigma70/sigma32)